MCMPSVISLQVIHSLVRGCYRDSAFVRVYELANADTAQLQYRSRRHIHSSDTDSQPEAQVVPSIAGWQ